LPDATDSSESLKKILRVARQLSRPFDIKEALEQIVDSGCEVLRADRASVFLFDPFRNELYGEATSSRDEIRFPADKGIAGQCLTEGRMIRVDDCYADPRFNRKVDEETGYRSKALLSVPLIGIEQEPVGVMQLLNPERGHFDASDESLAEMFAGFASVAIQRAKNVEDRLRTAKMEHDLSLAREIQQGLLPGDPPEFGEYELAVHSRPADETGGDIYDLVTITNGPDDTSLTILLADATGHGIGAALSVTQVRSMLRMAARAGVDLNGLCLHLNNQLAADLPSSKFVTAFIGNLDPRRHVLSYQAMGQAPLLHFHAATQELDILAASTLPMGLFEHPSLPEPLTMELDAGDTVLLLSDGVYEYANAANEQFGEDRVAEIVKSSADENVKVTLETLLRDLDEFADGAPQEDDITAVMIKRRPR